MFEVFRRLFRAAGRVFDLSAMAGDRRDRTDTEILAVSVDDTNRGRLVARGLRHLGKHAFIEIYYGIDTGCGVCDVFGARTG